PALRTLVDDSVTAVRQRICRNASAVSKNEPMRLSEAASGSAMTTFRKTCNACKTRFGKHPSIPCYNLSVSRVLMISSEAAPFARPGGLADVTGALPAALAEFGDEAAVVLPRYGSIPLVNARRVWERLFVHFGPDMWETTIFQAPAPYPVYLVDCPPLFDRKGLYGDNGIDYPDNHIRFAVFARAAIGVARNLFRTDIFHCHDWQSGLVPAYLRTTFASDPSFFGARTLFTIHNLGYQGLFPKTALTEVGLDSTV